MKFLNITVIIWSSTKTKNSNTIQHGLNILSLIRLYELKSAILWRNCYEIHWNIRVYLFCRLGYNNLRCIINIQKIRNKTKKQERTLIRISGWRGKGWKYNFFRLIHFIFIITDIIIFKGRGEPLCCGQHWKIWMAR